MGDNGSSYSKIESIWSNAVRLTRSVYPNLQDEIEYIEANLGGGGNISCNCSALEFAIENLSNIKLSRDGSQAMEGELVCNSGLKTDIIKARTQSIIDCQNQLRVYQSLGGDGDSGLWLGSDFSFGAPSINLYPYSSSANGKIFIRTPRSSGFAGVRVEIPGKNDFINIKIKDSNLIPYDDNYQDLGSSSNRWKNIYAVSGNFSGVIIPDEIISNADDIANLSLIKLSRDGSQSMIGLLKCESGLETNTVSTYSGSIIECENNLKIDGEVFGDSSDGLMLKAEDISAPAAIQLTPGAAGKIIMSTGTPQPALLPRVEIPWGSGIVDITVKYAHLIPYTDSDQNLGASDKYWKNVYARYGNFIYTKSQYRVWSDDTLRVGHGTTSADITIIKFTPTDIILGTPNSEGTLTERMSLTGGVDNSIVYIKQAHLLPSVTSSYYLGSSAHKWAKVYADKGYFSNVILPDAVLLNSANITSNANNIENLSAIKLSRDGSQTMTGSLRCESGLKTNSINSYSGDTVECNDIFKVTENIVGDSNDGLNLLAEDADTASRIQLTSGSTGKIILATNTPQSVVLPRIEIPSGPGQIDIAIRYAHVIPDIDNQQNLGNSNKRWKNIYAVSSLFSNVQVESRIWSNNTFTIGYSNSTTENSQIRLTATDLTLMTPDSNGTSTERLSLTGNADRSIVYIKNAHLLPYDNLSSYLGSTAHRWLKVFADTGSFTKIDALSSSVLDVDDDVKLDRRLWGKNDLILAGGDPSYGHAQIKLYNKSNLGHISLLSTDSSGVARERVRIEGDQETSTIIIKKADIEPYDDNTYRLGSSGYRWSDIYAVNTHWGDLGFVETICPKCNKKFKIGDNIILKVVRFNEEDGGIMTIPIHLECAKLPMITIKRRYPVKEKYYEWDERQGRVVARWRTKKQKKKIKKKRLKSGYKINQKTGKIETSNRKNIDLSEAIEEVEEETEEIVYKEKEIKI